jgi:hypothetical protein
MAFGGSSCFRMNFEMASLPWQEIELDDIRKGMTISTAAVEHLADSRKVPFVMEVLPERS